MGADAGTGAGFLTSLRLRILATSDLHAQLRPHDYFSDADRNSGSLTQLAGLIDALRDEAPNCLLVDNGDTLQGTPMADLAAATGLRKGRAHPMIVAMNTLGYDAMSIGNHDFNYGLEFLQTALAGADFPAVLANIHPTGEVPLVPASVILERSYQDRGGTLWPLRIGVVGLAPPQTLKWDQSLLAGKLRAEDMVDAARREVARLRAAEADLVILLSHTGFGPAEATPGLENAVLPLAALDGVDAIVAGHTHQVFPRSTSPVLEGVDPATGKVFGTPVVQPGSEGSHLGMIELELAQFQPGHWQVVEGRSEAIPVTADRRDATTAAAQDPLVAKLLSQTEPEHQATLSFVRRQIGLTKTPIHTYFSLLKTCAAVQIVNDAQRAFAETLVANGPLSDLPLLSAAAPFKAGGRGGPSYFIDIPPGPLAIRNAADLYTYPNRLMLLRVTGAQLRLWLERAACAFHQIAPGRPDQALIDHAFPGYNFDVLDGLSYEIDVSVPAKFSANGETEFETPGRIQDLRHAGEPVRDTDMFLVVTNSYRAAGGGHFAAAAAAEVISSDPVLVRDVVIRHIAYQTELVTTLPDTWRFASLSGTEVIAEIGPGALNHPADIARLDLAYKGQASTGFARFGLTL